MASVLHARKSDSKQIPLAAFTVPTVTEDDLLDFQISHFGDDTRPETFFIDAETALYAENGQVEEDDLGYYEDGSKRTLTDDQIAMFRHTEIELLLRKEKEQQEVEEEMRKQRPSTQTRQANAADAKHDALDSNRSADDIQQPDTHRSHSQTPSSELSTHKQARHRNQEIAYENRNKRKWEAYIESTDPVEGSMTHRRLARELDDQQDKTVDLEY